MISVFAVVAVLTLIIRILYIPDPSRWLAISFQDLPNVTSTTTASNITPRTQGYYFQPSVQERLKREVREAAHKVDDVIHSFGCSSSASFFQLAADESSQHSPPCSHNYAGKKVVRAITGFMPSRVKFFNEFKSLMLSVALMRLEQPADIKTDIVIFVSEGGSWVDRLLDAGCVQKERKEFSDPEMCIIKIKSGQTGQGSADWLTDDDPVSKYPYGHSMTFLSGLRQGYKYDLILRTDLDVFITPGFANWLPRPGFLLYTGHGGYGSMNALKRLKWISETRLNLKTNDLKDIGSTWYGAADLVISLSELSVAVMRWLLTQEFSEYEACCSGVDGWPYWHWGVSSMYSGHIAINHVNKDVVTIKNDSEYLMDYFSDSEAALTSQIKHIHSWHTDKRFSKFAFELGKYDSLNLTDFANMKSSQDFCTMIAMAVKRMSPAEFMETISHTSRLKDGTWKKLLPRT